MKSNVAVVIIFLALGFWPDPKGAASAEAPYYEGKTLTVIEGRNPGGAASLRTQAIMKYVQKHLPGHPAIVYQFMSAGGGTGAANHMAYTVKRDGLTIASIGTAVYSNAIFGAPGVRYKLSDFAYLGSPAPSGGPYALVVRPGLGLDSVEKLRTYKGLRLANRQAGHGMYVAERVMVFVLGLDEPRWILGYGDPELDIALERGEADALTNNPRTFMRETPHWLKQGFTIPVVMKDPRGQGVESVPGFPQTPATVDRYIDTELKRKVLQLFKASKPSTTVFFVSKGIPDAAFKPLKEAFNRAWKDPEFAKEYERMTNLPTDPMLGDEIEQALQELPNDPHVMDIYKQVIGAGPLPSSR
jgi:hypothetical protein